MLALIHEFKCEDGTACKVVATNGDIESLKTSTVDSIIKSSAGLHNWLDSLGMKVKSYKFTVDTNYTPEPEESEDADEEGEWGG